MSDGLATLLVLILIVVVCIAIWAVKTLNQLKRYKVVIDESKKDADIALTKRYSTINDMFKVAKSYAHHETELMVNLTKARTGGTIEETNETLRNQDAALDRVYAVGENYPQMLSSEQFLNLQNAIKDENAEYAAAKRIVNSNISILNQMIVSFPTSVVASNHGIKEMPFLEEPEDKKKDIDDINFEL